MDPQIRNTRFAASRALLNRAARSIPGGVNTSRRNVTPPLCLRRGAGAYVEDVAGNRYLDYHAAYGAVVLGHSPPAVVEHVQETIASAVLFGIGVTEPEAELAERITRHVASAQQVLLCLSGSEATFHAIRLARGVTGRRKILKFQGSYNGGNDYVLRNGLSALERLGQLDPGSAGILDCVLDETLVARYNDVADVAEVVAPHLEDLAGVILEPVLHNAPAIMPRPGFLESLRDLCDRTGAVLIFDETITGFRHALGGYQSLCGVTPDITTLGKAIANGFPLAAVCGRRDLMQRFNTTSDGDVFFAGTYNGYSAGTAAANATIAQLESAETYAHMYGLGERMRVGLREVTARLGVPAVVSGHGSLFALSFMQPPLETYEDALRADTHLASAYRQELLMRGILMMPHHSGRDHISASHSSEDVDLTLEAVEEALRRTLDANARNR